MSPGSILRTMLGEGHEDENEKQNDDEVHQEMAEGDLLGYACRGPLQHGKEDWEEGHADQCAGTFEEKMGKGRPPAVDIAGDASYESSGGGADVRPDDDGNGVVYGNESLLAEDDEHPDGYCRCLDDRREDEADEEPYEGVLGLQEVLDEERAVLERGRGIADEAEPVKDRSKIEQRLANDLKPAFCDEVKCDPDEQEKRRDIGHLPDDKLYGQRCSDVGAEDDAE